MTREIISQHDHMGRIVSVIEPLPSPAHRVRTYKDNSSGKGNQLDRPDESVEELTASSDASTPSEDK
jgi:hypothetical protein